MQTRADGRCCRLCLPAFPDYEDRKNIVGQRFLNFVTLRNTVCLWLALCLAPAVQASSVFIVMDEGNAGFAEVAQILGAELARDGQSVTELRAVSAKEIRSADAAAHGKPKVWVTLGATAFQQVLAVDPKAQVIAALIPKSGFDRTLKELGKKPVGPVTGLLLDQPVTRQMDLLKLVFPAVKRVGVLLGPESGLQRAALQQAAKARGLELVSGMVTSDETLSTAVNAVVGDAQALLALPDSQVFSSTTISKILLAAYRANVPMLAFSPAYVKAGAVLSLHTTPAQMESQLVELVRGSLQGRTLPSTQYPTSFVITVNPYVARSMELTLDAANLTDHLRRLETNP